MAERKAKRQAKRATGKWIKKGGGYEVLKEIMDEAAIQKAQAKAKRMTANKGGSVRARLSKGGPVAKPN